QWSVMVDGIAVQHGALNIPHLDPQSHTPLTIPMVSPRLIAGQVSHVNVSFCLTRDLPWAKKGDEIAWEQFVLSCHKPRLRAPRAHKMTTTASDDIFQVAWQGDRPGSLTINRQTGRLEELMFADEQVLAAGPALSIFRAPTDNDGRMAAEGTATGVLSRWLAWGLDRIRPDCSSIRDISKQGIPGFAVTHHIGTKEGRIHHEQTLQILAPGDLLFQESIRIPKALNDLPRLGIVLELLPGFENLEYFARGPHENYRDRNRGARLGRYTDTVTNQYVPYILPQEHGNRSDMHWCALNNGQSGVLIIGPTGGDFSASHYREEDLFHAAHTHELEPVDETRIHIDLVNRGVGTGACGPDTLPSYRIGGGTHIFSWRLMSFIPGKDDLAELARRQYRTANGARPKQAWRKKHE
ncbi:MAG: beta-galactosidase domain 4-containing protein, partial [Desulfobacterales bacterium]